MINHYIKASITSIFLINLAGCYISEIPPVIVQTSPNPNIQQATTVIIINHNQQDISPSTPLLIKQKQYCLDVHGNNGKELIRHLCHGKSNQQFTFESDNTIRQNGQCLDVAGHSQKDGTQVILYPCTQKDNQKWYQDGKQIRSKQTGKCLDTRTNQVRIYTCNQRFYQQFEYELPNQSH